jgi:uncharacterized protein (TIGR00375 family)
VNGFGEMRIIADLQIHSKYSGATSSRMVLEELSYYARLKGLDVLGTGDALHPNWMEELKRGLEKVDEKGVYRLRASGGGPLFIVQTEVATIHELDKKTRRIHHVILFRDLETAAQAADLLSKYGDLRSDGRPILNITPAYLVELMMEVSQDCLIFPAHAWTPWWSIFGAISGVDTVEECYEDKSDKIYAIETGLSSDPLMNWRVSRLDSYTLLSSSDSHSPYPYRLGREAVVFELEDVSYDEIVDAIKKKDSKRIIMTLEVPPSYGKYHWSGHRRCGVGPIPPARAREMGYRCPICGRRLTKGVEDRVEELADRPPGARPPGAIDFKYVIPLQELITVSMGLDYSSETALNSKKVWQQYMGLINSLGNEFQILLDAPLEKIAEVSGPRLATLIADMRRGAIKIRPGYDGVYGRIVFGSAGGDTSTLKQKGGSLEDFL